MNKPTLADLLAQCNFDEPMSAEEREWLDMPEVGRERMEHPHPTTYFGARTDTPGPTSGRAVPGRSRRIARRAPPDVGN